MKNNELETVFAAQNEKLSARIDALTAQIAAMSVQQTAASGATPFAGLNQWALQDKPRMEDFNADNLKVDEKLRALSENKVDKGPTSTATLWTGESSPGTQIVVPNALAYQQYEATTSYYTSVRCVGSRTGGNCRLFGMEASNDTLQIIVVFLIGLNTDTITVQRVIRYTVSSSGGVSVSADGNLVGLYGVRNGN